MSQTRLFIECSTADARALSPAVEAAFEEEGYPVASFETDTARGRWSLSLYIPQEAEAEIENRLKNILSSVGVTAAIEREALGDTDWVSQTLSELSPVRAGRFVVHGSHDRNVPHANEIAVEIESEKVVGGKDRE